MKHSSLKTIFAATLLLAVSAAFFVCLTFANFTAGASSHVHSDAQHASDVAVAHITHALEFSLATAASDISFNIAALLLLLPLFAYILPRIISEGVSCVPLLRVRKRRTASKQEREQTAYILRFVRSPEFI